MNEEIDMELQFEVGLLFVDVDIDYEFDAPRYFELDREESPWEAQKAELWFEMAGNYPPSPFISKLRSNKNVEQDNVDNDSDVPKDAYPSSAPSFGFVSFTGSAFDAFTQHDLQMDIKHNTSKETVARRPNYMKATASQLAKQKLIQRNKISRFQKPSSVQKWNSEDSSHWLLHPAKRLKLAGGHIYQVFGMTQQNELRHKTLEKKCGANCKSNPPRMRLTIPREPVLETSRRAQNFRAQRSKNSEGSIVSRSAFKARPLNRKILEAPKPPFPQKSVPKLPEFQEFNLKTSARAFQHSLAAAASEVERNCASTSIVKDFRTGSNKPQYYPLSKDTIARSARKSKVLNQYEKELAFSITKRCQQQNPLSELFNKLSLSSEARQVNEHHSNFAESTHLQDSKENVVIENTFMKDDACNNLKNQKPEADYLIHVGENLASQHDQIPFG